MSLRSLTFGWEFPPKHAGGLGVACQGMAKGLVQNGVHMTMVLPFAMDAEEEDGVHFLHAKPGQHTELRYISIPSLLQPYDTPEAYAQRIQQCMSSGKNHTDLYGGDLWEAIERFGIEGIAATKDSNPDVVHCHDWMTYEAAYRASNMHDCPMIAHVHATELDRTHFSPNGTIADIEQKGLRRADRIIAVSSYTKQLLIKHYGITADKISVVHNGHDAQPKPKQHNADRPKLVLFVGRMTIQKNPFQFLEVAKRIVDHRSNVQFAMAGDGHMIGELMDRTCALGLDQHMIFTGKAPKAEIEKLFASADCFVMPSLSEPFGLVALEAIEHGVPVVLSRQSGASEVVDHAFKVDFWDTDKMADCIVTILREEDLSMQMSSASQEVLHRLTWKNQAGKIKDIYSELATHA